jgi:predicted NAD/FAD-binding protein
MGLKQWQDKFNDIFGKNEHEDINHNGYKVVEQDGKVWRVQSQQKRAK